jgi:hypothetical protein
MADKIALLYTFCAMIDKKTAFMETVLSTSRELKGDQNSAQSPMSASTGAAT